MGRFGRLIALAVAAVALSAAQVPNAGANEQQNAAGSSASNAAQNVTSANDEQAERAHRAKYEAQCNPGDDERDSDLCAQWKAADAAADSARWAKWSTWESGVSGVLVLIAIGLAFEANHIARQTAKRQLRAYVTIEPAGVNAPENENVRVPVVVENVGETPANKVMIFSRFAIDGDPINFDPSKLVAPDSWLKGEINDASLGRGVRRYMYPYVKHSFMKPHMLDIADKRQALIHFGYVIYEDVFGKTHRTHFAFYHWGEKLDDRTALRCRLGNSAD